MQGCQLDTARVKIRMDVQADPLNTLTNSFSEGQFPTDEYLFICYPI